MKTVLCTVGSEKYPFDRMMHWIEIIAREYPQCEFFVQTGSCKYIPKADNIESFKFLSENEFSVYLRKADLLIGHCGEGTIIQATNLQKPYILIPRKSVLGEHVDDHQFDLAKLLNDQGAGIAFSIEDLRKKVTEPKFVEFKIDQVNTITQLEKLMQSPMLDGEELNFDSNLLLICSGGGHYHSMYLLKGFYEKFKNRSWVTFKVKNIEIDLENENVIWAFHPTIRNIPNFVRNLILAFKTLPKRKPEIIITTGAGVAVPFLIAARLITKTKIIFVELTTRVEKLSLSAKILYKLNIIDYCFVRHGELKKLYEDDSKIVLVEK